jgi:hypothetical protein
MNEDQPTTLPTTHELKTWPKYFEAMKGNKKTFDIRENDRDYREGDSLFLREWKPASMEYTGRTLRVKVVYVMRDQPWVPEGYVVMGIMADEFAHVMQQAAEVALMASDFYRRMEDLYSEHETWLLANGGGKGAAASSDTTAPTDGA